MSKMEEIAGLLKELEHELSACARCGMCQAVCPLFKETGREGDVARGKLALLNGLLENLFDNPEGVKKRLDRCLLCGSCAANCPNGVNAVAIFLKARTVLSSVTGLSPLKRSFLKRLLANPDAFDRAVNWGRRLQKWTTKPESKILGTVSSKYTSPLLSKNRHFVPPARTSFHELGIKTQTTDNPKGPKVLFFTGCLIDKIFPRIAEAALKVFRHHGIPIIIPEHQGCCGIPALSAGDADTAKQLIHHHLAIFKNLEFDFLVTACATCTYTIKKIWPMLVDDGNNEISSLVREFSTKTRDINEFVVSEIGVAPSDRKETGSENGERITYHDPCHLKKSLGVTKQPRSLLSVNPRYQLIEMKKADQCCGMGGSFNLDYYDLSSQIGNRKLDSIRETNCRVIATGCPACMIQLSDTLSRAKADILVKHPIEIYAEHLVSKNKPVLQVGKIITRPLKTIIK